MPKRHPWRQSWCIYRTWRLCTAAAPRPSATSSEHPHLSEVSAPDSSRKDRSRECISEALSELVTLGKWHGGLIYTIPFCAMRKYKSIDLVQFQVLVIALQCRMHFHVFNQCIHFGVCVRLPWQGVCGKCWSDFCPSYFSSFLAPPNTAVSRNLSSIHLVPRLETLQRSSKHKRTILKHTTTPPNIPMIYNRLYIYTLRWPRSSRADGASAALRQSKCLWTLGQPWHSGRPLLTKRDQKSLAGIGLAQRFDHWREGWMDIIHLAEVWFRAALHHFSHSHVMTFRPWPVEQRVLQLARFIYKCWLGLAKWRRCVMIRPAFQHGKIDALLVRVHRYDMYVSIRLPTASNFNQSTNSMQTAISTTWWQLAGFAVAKASFY